MECLCLFMCKYIESNFKLKTIYLYVIYTHLANKAASDIRGLILLCNHKVVLLTNVLTMCHYRYIQMHL